MSIVAPNHTFTSGNSVEICTPHASFSRCQWLQQKRVKAYSRVFCFSSFLTTLFSLNHQLNCIADYFLCFHLYLFATLLLVALGAKTLYFCSNLCNFSGAHRVNCQHLFLDFYLLCLPNIFRYVFVRLLLFWFTCFGFLPSRHEILIRFSHSHNFITTTFPQNNNTLKLNAAAENVNKLVSVLLCCTLSPRCLFSFFSCFFH